MPYADNARWRRICLRPIVDAALVRPREMILAAYLGRTWALHYFLWYDPSVLLYRPLQKSAMKEKCLLAKSSAAGR